MRKPFFLMVLATFALGHLSTALLAQSETPRRLAPGVLRVVEPDLRVEEAVGAARPLIDLPISEFQPQTLPLSDTAAVRMLSAPLKRDIWGVEFGYLPLRMIEADVPQPTGKMQRKTIWYLVFRIAFDGQVMTFGSETDALGNRLDVPEVTDVANSKLDEIRLFPSFVLRASVVDPETGEVTMKEYLDRIMPTVVDQVRNEEDPAVPLATTVSISSTPIYTRNDGFSERVEYWGVATWEDVDPRTDYATVQVQGLTNAFRVIEGDGEKEFSFKTLQLNFYRPGDEYVEVADRIRPGIPLVDKYQEQLEIIRQYQLPGPQLSVYKTNKEINLRDYLLSVETTQDADLNTVEAEQLSTGEVPDQLLGRLTAAGFDVIGSTSTELIPNRRWNVPANERGESIELEVELVPGLWRKHGLNFEFNDRLEAFWLYR
ncbi:MAG: hypothetical protein R3B96_21445 [Pirellulaceae bacterium]